MKQNEDLNKIIAMDRRKKERQQNRENGWKDGAMKSSKLRQDNHDSEPETEEVRFENFPLDFSYSLGCVNPLCQNNNNLMKNDL